VRACVRALGRGAKVAAQGARMAVAAGIARTQMAGL